MVRENKPLVDDSPVVTLSQEEMQNIIHDFALYIEAIDAIGWSQMRIDLLRKFKSDTLKATYFNEVKPNGR